MPVRYRNPALDCSGTGSKRIDGKADGIPRFGMPNGVDGNPLRQEYPRPHNQTVDSAGVLQTPFTVHLAKRWGFGNCV